MSSKEGSFFATDSDLRFGVLDYLIFGLMLFLSTLIGLYYGFWSKNKQNNTKEYLLGGKRMKVIPVAMSLVASHVSGSTLLGVPSEIYANGTQYWAVLISSLFVAFGLIYVYLPVFSELQLTSCFTYLEIRFDRKVRVVASALYALSVLVYIPVVIYVPALAFAQATGINIHLITPALCLICIFYTTIGGLRAVVWTDTLQFMLMLVSIITIICKGVEAVGSFFDVWKIADNGGRLIFFNMDPSPFARSSFWTVALGLSVLWVSMFGVNQSSVQRFLSVPNFSDAKRLVWIYTLGLVIIKSLSVFTGLLIYAKYEHCDPVSTGKIGKLDQITPYYVMDVCGSIPGIPGLFIAGIFSAALSTMSTSLNTLSGSIYEDFIRNRIPNASEKTASNFMKLTVVVLGVIVILLVYVVEKMGAIFKLTISLSGITAGTLLGLFSVGMLSRKINTKGVIAGCLSSTAFITFLVVGAFLSKKPKEIYLPVQTDQCLEYQGLNYTTTTATTTMEEDYIFPLFRISFMYFSLLGVLILVIVAYPVSIWTGGTDNLDERLLSPIIRCEKLNKKKTILINGILYDEIDLIKQNLQETEAK